ncbi:MAG: hypothetical protein ACK587_08455 [Cyanobacteriota bacterium]
MSITRFRWPDGAAPVGGEGIGPPPLSCPCHGILIRSAVTPLLEWTAAVAAPAPARPTSS